jgi:hypothetical protein
VEGNMFKAKPKPKTIKEIQERILEWRKRKREEDEKVSLLVKKAEQLSW